MSDDFTPRIWSLLLGVGAACAGMFLVPGLMHMHPDSGTGAMTLEAMIGTTATVICAAGWAGALFGLDALLPFLGALVFVVLALWNTVTVAPPWLLWGIAWPILSVLSAGAAGMRAEPLSRRRTAVMSVLSLIAATYVVFFSLRASYQANQLMAGGVRETLGHLSRTVLILPPLRDWAVSYNAPGPSSCQMYFRLMRASKAGRQRVVIRCDLRTGECRVLRLQSHQRHVLKVGASSLPDARRLMREHGLADALRLVHWSPRDSRWELRTEHVGYEVSVRLCSDWLWVDAWPSAAHDRPSRSSVQ